jgi:hypothetical protein
LLSAIAAGIVALLTIYNHRRVARTQLAYSTYSRIAWDKDFLNARNVFLKLRNDQNGLIGWAQKDKESTDEVKSIKAILNDYELIALGIDSWILDEEFYFNLVRGALLEDWDAAKPFVQEIRRRYNYDEYFKGFEGLADRWKAIEPGKFPQTWHEKALRLFR